MNRRLILTLCLALLFSGCSDDMQEEQSGRLYADLPKDTLVIDTIQTAKPLDFKMDTVYEYAITEPAEYLPKVNSLQRQNVFEKDEGLMHHIYETDTIHDVFPDTVKAEPYFGYLTHPQPIKAGEMASSKYAAENIQVLGIDQGLNSPRVASIVEDQFGFMWFSLSTGLTRYDGNYFYHYTTDNGLVSNNISDLFIDPDNRLWICTEDKGVMIYDGAQLEIYSTKNGLTSDQIYGMRTDKKDNVWFLGGSGGVSKFDGENFYQYTEKSGLLKNDAFCIGFDHKGQLFYSTVFSNPDVLNVEENYIVRKKVVMDGLSFYGSTMTMNTFNDTNGDLWTVSYNGGVTHILNDTISLQTRPKTGLNYLAMSCGLQDSKGNFWYSMTDAGISYDNGSNYVGYTEEGGINSNIVFHLMEDSKGNIWAATTQGVVKIVPESFKNMTSKDGMTDKSITAIDLSTEGHLLLSSWTAGLFAFDGNRFETYRGGSIVLDMKKDYFGNLKAGVHQAGIMTFTPSENDTLAFDTFYKIPPETGFKPWNILTMEVDSEGNLWAGCEVNGLYCLRLNEDKTDYASIEHYTANSGLINNHIDNIYIDKQGAIWTVYRSAVGVSIIKDGKIEHQNTHSGFPTDHVNEFYEDSKGNFWIASRDGLFLRDGEKYHSFTTANGMSYNYTTSIIEDSAGRLWVGSKNGLNMLVKDGDGKAEYTITTFGSKDGLSGSSFIDQGVVIDSTNTIWWVTTHSLISLDLDRFDHQYITPEVTITDISIMTDHINFKDLDDTANVDLGNAEIGEAVDYFNVPSTISLPYEMNSLTLKYGSMKGNPIHHMNYRYWLKGFHDDWVKPTRKVEVEFINLPPGNYDFHVQARLANKAWGPTTTYQFEIRSPYWQKWWFRIIMVFLLVYVVYVVVRLRNKQLRKRQEELEQTVKRRTFEIEQQKHIIEEKQTEILDSINYAQRIQRSLLATDAMLTEHLKDYFVFFQPKDVVSGDFYWATPLADGRFTIVNADSTGHGVPGAIMSMLNISSLEKAMHAQKLIKPAEILNYTRKVIIDTLAKDGSAEGGKDGMDCSLIRFDFEKNLLTYSAAHNGLWIIRNNELLEFKADKMPVGKHTFDDKSFQQHDVELKKDDVVYTFTDGYPDQFGGEKGKKFKYKSLKKLLMDLHHLPMNEQQKRLNSHFNQWKGDLEQLDDVCLIGVRIS